MRERVARHQARRPSAWQTIEEPLNPARVVKQLDGEAHIFLLDCLTLLISNLILQPDIEPDEEQVVDKIAELAQVGYESAAHVIIVSNEVGWGIVPGDPLSRLYRDIIGRANQKIAACADQSYITIAGIPVELKALENALLKR